MLILSYLISIILMLLFSVLQEFKVPQKPFKRMTYTDAVTFLKENNITKEDGSFYEFGDVSNMLAGTCYFQQCGILTSVD